MASAAAATRALPRVLGKRLGSLPIGLTAGLAFVVAYGLHHGWDATIGRAFQWLGHKGINISLRGVPDVHIHPFGFLLNIDHDARAWLNDAQRYAEKGMVWGFTNFALPFVLAAGVILALGMAVFELGEWTASYVQKTLSFHHAARTDPRLSALETDILRDEARLREIEQWKRAGGAAAGAQDWAQLRRGIDRLKSRVTELEKAQHGTAHADVHTGEAAHPDVLGIPHWLARRLSGVEKATVGVGAAALVATALGRLGLGWLKCPALGRIGRKVGCGGFHFAELLLAETLDVLLIRDLCRVVKTIERLAIAFEGDLLALVDEIEGFICGGEEVVPSGIVRADLKRVAKRPTGITAYDLQPPVGRKIAA